MDTKSLVWRGTVVLAGLMALIFAVWLPWQLQRQVRFLMDGEQVAALVVGEVVCHRGSELTTCMGDVRFQTADGDVRTVEIKLPTGAERGDAYWIRYLRDDPTEATTLSSRWILIAAIALFSAALVGLVIGVAWGARYVRRTLRAGRERSRYQFQQLPAPAISETEGKAEHVQAAKVFMDAASTLRLMVEGEGSIGGVIDGFRVTAVNHGTGGEDLSSPRLEVRVYLALESLPERLEVDRWDPWLRVFSLFAWLPFVTGYRRVGCPDGAAKGVIAKGRSARDEWLTPRNIARVCALKSELTYGGFFRPGPVHLKNIHPPPEGSAQIVSAVSEIVDDARAFTR